MKLKLGRIPDRWSWAASGDVIDVRDGTHDTPKYVDEGFPLITSKNLKPQGIDFEDVGYISKQDHIAISKRSQVDRGDILFAMIGTIGNPVVVNEDREFSIKNVALFKCSTGGVDPHYCYRLLDSPLVKMQLTDATRGGTQKFVSLKVLRNLQIPLPPLAEQKRIAGILDAADALRAKRSESLAQLDTLLKSTFLDMFGDPVTNPMGWNVRPMGQLMRIRRGGSPRPIAKYLGGNINWIKIGDATNTGDDIYITSCAEKIIEEGLNKTTLLEPGSFVFANCGVSLGFARILKIKGAIHDGWLAFDEYSSDVLNELFFLKTLNRTTDHFRRIAPSGTQPNLNIGIMKAFELILPPIDLQHHFATIVEAVEQQKASQRVHLDVLDTLFSSLQSRAFQGEL